MTADQFNRWQQENAILEQSCFDQAKRELGKEATVRELADRAQQIKLDRKSKTGDWPVT